MIGGVRGGEQEEGEYDGRRREGGDEVGRG